MEHPLIAKFSKFVKEIKETDKTCLFYHMDTDGITSAAIVTRALKKIANITPILKGVRNERDLKSALKFSAELKELKINKIIIVDWSYEEYSEALEKFEEYAKILTIDHHKLLRDANSNKHVFIKPQLLDLEIEPSKYPASKLCFDLFSKEIELGESDWLSVAGLIGDMSIESWKDFYEKVIKKYNISLRGKNSIEKVHEIITSVEAVNSKDTNELVLFLSSVNNPKEVFNSKFRSYLDKFEDEFNYWLEKAKTEAEIFEDVNLVFFIVSPKYFIKSELATVLGARIFPNNTIIVIVDDESNKYSISARRQDFKIPMNSLLKKACENFESATCGGHIPAAGGHILKKDLSKFKKKVIELLKKNKFD